MNKSGDNQDYTWTVGDVRNLDSRMNGIEDKGDRIEKKADQTYQLLQEFIKKSDKQSVIVSKGDGNTLNNLTAKAVIIGTVIATAVATAIKIIEGIAK